MLKYLLIFIAFMFISNVCVHNGRNFDTGARDCYPFGAETRDCQPSGGWRTIPNLHCRCQNLNSKNETKIEKSSEIKKAGCVFANQHFNVGASHCHIRYQCRCSSPSQWHCSEKCC